ncbi:MAG TPA: radical SAM family heme chaperone HemW [Alphaproteobacteria bacterium]|nr:radical SAM family heme chaperone HemW [Alphaproteobacteria bacterium]
MPNLAVYIHWPYCVAKCPYCDFNSHVGDVEDQARWRAAYAREIGYYAEALPDRRVTSVFFGGGTPSLMEPATVAAVLGEVARHWNVADDCEITLEANPNSAEAGKFAGFRAAGVNRLSLGVQALNDEALRFLSRAHDASEARRAIELARGHFPRFSFDLIYARKDQSVAAWAAELQEALQLANGHLSLYQLTIEPNTQFHTRHQRGEVLTAPEDEAVRMYEMTQAILGEAGMPAYEVSNHARPGAESRHNLSYWRYEDYIGIGPGAHGRYQIVGEDGAFSFARRMSGELGERRANIDPSPAKTKDLVPPKNGTKSKFSLPPPQGGRNARFAADNHRAPEVWLSQVTARGNGLRLCEPLDEATAMREALMMGLRLAEGIDPAAWAAKFSAPLEAYLDAAKVARLIEEGYLARDARYVRATAAGLQRLNAVLHYLTN